MNKVQKRLKKARKLVEKGWAQGYYRAYDYDGEKMCYCLTGAILAAGMKNPEDLEVGLPEGSTCEEAVLAVAGAAVPDVPSTDGVWGVMAIWNDAPDRTHEEVLLAFDDAIAAKA